MEGNMPTRTIFLSRLIGLYCILAVPSLLLHRQATVDAIAGLLHNSSMILVLGVITLAAGLAMILAHNIWRGGALVVVVTLVGWLVLIKALLFLFLPLGAEAECILRGLRHPQLFYVCMIPSLVLGIYLTYGGFSSKSRSRRDAS
jgi:hypothetical protein